MTDAEIENLRLRATKILVLKSSREFHARINELLSTNDLNKASKVVNQIHRMLVKLENEFLSGKTYAGLFAK